MGLLWSRIADGGPRFGGKPREGFLRGGTGNPMPGPNLGSPGESAIDYATVCH